MANQLPDESTHEYQTNCQRTEEEVQEDQADHGSGEGRLPLSNKTQKQFSSGLTGIKSGKPVFLSIKDQRLKIGI